jgi:hypothetical protein
VSRHPPSLVLTNGATGAKMNTIPVMNSGGFGRADHNSVKSDFLKKMIELRSPTFFALRSLRVTFRRYLKTSCPNSRHWQSFLEQVQATRKDVFWERFLGIAGPRRLVEFCHEHLKIGAGEMTGCVMKGLSFRLRKDSRRKCCRGNFRRDKSCGQLCVAWLANCLCSTANHVAVSSHGYRLTRHWDPKILPFFQAVPYD